MSTMQTQLKAHPVRTSVLVFGAIGIVIAAALYYFLVLRDESGASAQTASQVEFEVGLGNIVSATSLSGTLVYSQKEQLTFGGAGTVDEVMVTDGQTVAAGDPVASLDDVSVARLVAAVADAETAVSQAQTKYNNALSGASGRLNLAEAEDEQAQAEIALKAAEKSLLDIDGSESSAVLASREALDDAQAALDAAREDLAEVLSPENNGLQSAEEDLAAAAQEYEDILARWFAGPLTEDQLELSPDEILDQWGVTLDELFSVIAIEWDESPTPWVDDLSTPWNEATLWSWTHLLPIIVDTESTTESRSTSVVTPLPELNAAWNALVAERAAYKASETGADSAINAAESAVTKAEDAVEAAEDNLESLIDPALLRSREAAVVRAQIRLDEAKDALAAVESENEVAIKSAEAQLSIARQTLSDSESALETSTLTAPFDGIVTLVNVEAGGEVTSNQVIVEIVNSAELAVEADVDEEDILSIVIDAPAQITLDAVAGRTFTGYVSSIGQAVQSQQGAVTFPVLVTLDNTGNLNLLEGLTASAEIISSQTLDVLRIPVAAVGGTFIQPTVEVLENGRLTETPVQIGTSNGTYVEIVSGLTEAQTVVAIIAGDLGLDTDTQPGGFQVPGGGGGFQIPGGAGQGRGRFGGNAN